MKIKLALFLTHILISVNIYSQIKVDQAGHVGIGTNYPNPGYNLHIKGGSLLLSNHPSSPWYEFQFKAYSGGTRIGSTADRINMWEQWTSFNKIYAQSYNTISDSTLKFNITPVSNAISTILKLTAYSYDMEDRQYSSDGGKIIKKIKNIGFMAQEVKRIFPEYSIANESMGQLLLDYNQILPVAIAAIQEQQIAINLLSKEIESLKGINKNITTNSLDIQATKSVLYQNKPNPFKENTVIEFEIKTESFRSASLLLFNMNGVLIKPFAINSSEQRNIVIQASALTPGMYIYTLVVNDEAVDTKRMIMLE